MTNQETPPYNDNLGEDGFGISLFRVRMELHRQLERTLDERNFGLTFMQYRVLMSLGHRKIPPNASELARCLGYDAGAMTRLLDKMVDQGYVKRSPCEHDRRISNLSLTETGQNALQPMREIANSLIEKALSDLSPEEQQILKSLLLRVRTTLENMQ